MGEYNDTSPLSSLGSRSSTGSGHLGDIRLVIYFWKKIIFGSSILMNQVVV